MLEFIQLQLLILWKYIILYTIAKIPALLGLIPLPLHILLPLETLSWIHLIKWIQVFWPLLAFLRLLVLSTFNVLCLDAFQCQVSIINHFLAFPKIRCPFNIPGIFWTVLAIWPFLNFWFGVPLHAMSHMWCLWMPSSIKKEFRFGVHAIKKDFFAFFFSLCQK